jgi:hypothetical protein
MRIRTLVVLFSCICVFSAFSVGPQSDTNGGKELTIKDAEALVLAALSRETKRLPGLSLDAAPRRGRYITFDVLWNNPGPGSVHVDFYTVDLRSGELWRSILCEHVVSRTVARLQGKLRRRLGISPADVKRAIRDQTGCFP